MEMENAEDLELLLKTKVAKDAMDDIYKYRDRLIVIANAIYRAGVTIDPNDSAPEMAMFFLFKQMEHLASVTHLANQKCHRDTAVLARTMVEGAACLNWALLDAPTRPDLWYWFTLIDEWRTLQSNAARGMPYDSEHLANIGKAMEEHGIAYIRDNLLRDLKKAESEGKKLLYPHDPWAYEWTKSNVIDKIKLIDEGGSLEQYYRKSSQWAHWASPPMFRALKKDQYRRMFDNEAWTELYVSHLAAITGLAHVMKLTNRTLGLSFEKETDEILGGLHAALRDSALPLTLDFDT